MHQGLQGWHDRHDSNLLAYRREEMVVADDRGDEMKPFKPQLFPNDAIAIEDIPDNTYLVSMKLDGIRCTFKDGEMRSRSRKPIPNKRLHEKFAHLKEYSKDNGILDGELYSHELTFQEITSIVMTQDKEVPASLQFYCFDALAFADMPFNTRLRLIPEARDLVKVEQILTKKSEFERLMQKALDEGYEGLIIRNPMSKYKFGRVTTKSGDGYKLKNYRTFDARIHGFVQATVVRKDAVRKINELGYSETSKKKDDRIPVDKVAAFLVNHEGKELKVVYAATDTERAYAWQHRDDYFGRMIEFKGMLIGAKDLPRHPVFTRWRDDR